MASTKSKKKAILVYVQAVPVPTQARARSFNNISQTTTNLELSHSSKAALAKARELSQEREEVVAIGHSSVLHEAIVRGASRVVAVPLCDDPLAQAETMKNDVARERFAFFLVGENLEAPFSGASLCGAISSVCDLGLALSDSELTETAAAEEKDANEERAYGSVYLVRDDGAKSFSVDIRRIDEAFAAEIPDSGANGKAMLEKIQPRTGSAPSRTSLEESQKEVASMIARRLRRLSNP